MPGRASIPRRPARRPASASPTRPNGSSISTAPTTHFNCARLTAADCWSPSTCRSGDHEHVRVLIADDEPVARRGLRALLAAEPDVTIVGEAGDGEETEALLRAADVDVLILDIQMPQKSGL